VSASAVRGLSWVRDRLYALFGEKTLRYMPTAHQRDRKDAVETGKWIKPRKAGHCWRKRTLLTRTAKRAIQTDRAS
jgi:hypothetical protein